MTYEECCRCGNRTHRAGIGEDSIYFGDFGPYCEDCRDSIGEIFSDEITALRERVKVLEEVKAIYSEFITSNDLSAVDKHCDRVQFKHAWGALWNKRRCAAALEIKTLHPVFLFYT